MRQEGTVMKLLVHDVELKDAGEYTCVCGEQETTAALIVNGKKPYICTIVYFFTSSSLFVVCSPAAEFL